MTQKADLESVLQEHGFSFEPSTVKQLDTYLAILWNANLQVNLTRHTDYATFVMRDMTDVMQLSHLFEADEEILDIGSGGGVPGIVLSIVRPDLQISLCESVGKKAVLLKAFVESMELNIPVYNDRAEKVLEDLTFDACMARAVGPLWKLCTWLAPHWISARKLYAVKGPRWVDELAEAKERGLTKQLFCRKIVEYDMPGTTPDPNAEPVAGDVPAPTGPSKSVILEIKKASTG